MATLEETPGLLFVTMQPKDTLSLDSFHDWYNNEHGPTRLTMPFCTNGFRYRATDLSSGASTGTQDQPEYLAIYDITEMYELTQDLYMKYRAAPWKTQREADVMAQIWVGRTLWDDLGQATSENNFVKLESPDQFKEEAEGNVLTTTRFMVDRKHLYRVGGWIHDSVLPTIKKMHGWRRTRWLKQSSILETKDAKDIEILVINEFAPSTDVQGVPKFDISSIATSQNAFRTYKLFYTFGSAARNLNVVAPWRSYPGTTKTTPASASPYSAAAIESVVTTEDGTIIPYRLEGTTTDPNAPVVVLVNSVLVTYGIWDGFVKHFLSQPENQKYRVLRFMSRGRFSNTGSSSVTVDLLASDIIRLLDCLRISQVACLVGVSLGGATSLATALKYPSRIKSFISCDTSAKSPAGNREAWGQRIDVAVEEGKVMAIESDPNKAIAGSSGSEEPAVKEEAVVGEELAELTVRRWFVPESYQDTNIEKEIARVKQMVVSNSLGGFRRGVEALFNYDYTDLLPKYQGRGAFLVGAGDGALPKSMEETSKKLGPNGGEFKLIQKAGHLPMVEKPQEVADFVADFLKRA